MIPSVWYNYTLFKFLIEACILTELRTLLIDLSRYFGGASSRTLALLEGMSGNYAALATLSDSPVSQYAVEKCLNTHVVGRHKLDTAMLPQLKHLIRDQRIRVVDTQNPQSQFWARLAVGKTNAALVSTLNSWYFDEHNGNIKGRAYQMLQNLTHSRVDMFIAVSEQICNRLQESGVHEDRIRLIPNAIAIALDSIKADHFALCKEFEFPKDSVICCSVGRLVEAKGYTYLLNTLAKVVTTLPRLYCLIIGSGHLHQSLSEQIRQLGLEQRVRLAGNHPPNKTLQLMKSADMFIMPSITEGTPVALLEAAALKIPIIASRVGGIPSILTSDDFGLLIESADVTTLAEAIKSQYEQPGAAQKRAENAQAHVLSKYGIASQIEATRLAYEQALENQMKRRKLQ